MKHDLWRSKAVRRAYDKHRAGYRDDGHCDFCHFDKHPEQVLEQQTHFNLVRNLFPYDMWDGYRVEEHLMLVPKRHIDSISHFNDEEQREFARQLVILEEQGYSVYARSAGSKSKSVAHQHTHLMKLSDKHIDTVVYNQRLGRRLVG